jgi:hypothetical protein
MTVIAFKPKAPVIEVTKDLDDAFVKLLNEKLANYHTRRLPNPNSFVAEMASVVQFISLEHAIEQLVIFCNTETESSTFSADTFDPMKPARYIIPASLAKKIDDRLDLSVNCMYKYYLGQVIPNFIIEAYLKENHLRRNDIVYAADADYVQEILFDAEGKPRTIVQMMDYYVTKYNTGCDEEDFAELKEFFDVTNNSYVPDLVEIACNMYIPPALLLAHNLQMEYNGYNLS